jgi:glycosyltransferase involved in cell wall biosynthesis
MQMSQAPLVSVIIPSLNRAHYLVPTLESVLRQDYPSVECIVIDGGSHDESLEVLDHYRDRICLVSEPDHGHPDAVNKGLKMAHGEIVTWLNIDDCYTSHAIKNAVASFQKYPKAELLYGDYKVIDEDGCVLSNRLKPRSWDLAYAIQHCHYTITQPASFLRRTVFDKAGFLDTEIGNNVDHELWLRIGLRGEIQYVPEFFAYVRRCHGRSQLKSMAIAKVKTTEKILDHPELPLELRSNAFKRRAMSNAYVRGADAAATGHHWKSVFAFFGRAAMIDPLNVFAIAKRVFRAFPTLLPRPIKRFFQKRMELVRRGKNKAGSEFNPPLSLKPIKVSRRDALFNLPN